MINSTQIYTRLNVTPQQLANFCKQHQIQELAIKKRKSPAAIPKIPA